MDCIDKLTSENFVSESVKIFESLDKTQSGGEMFRHFIEFYAEDCVRRVQGIYDTNALEYARKQISDEAFKVLDLYIVKFGDVMRGNPKDYFGEICTKLHINNSKGGQVFTPSHISELMAAITMDDTIKQKKDIIHPAVISDPCCGTGSIAIGAARYIIEKDTEHIMHYTIVAQDADLLMARICYLQLIPLGIPAIINVGNSLVDEVSRRYYTIAGSIQKMMAIVAGKKPEDKDDELILDIAQDLQVLALLEKIAMKDAIPKEA